MSAPRVCPTPQKIRYRDRIAAELAAGKVGNRRHQFDRLEPYLCAGHWHNRTVVKRRGGVR